MLFCKKVVILNRQAFKQKGPLLIVANHPDSFLDAILIGAHFTENVHFLARGDAFKQKKHRILLKMLKMIPVYRLSEGRENLPLNDYAFTESKRILESGGIVLIFIEGICLNSHELQPFKKGAARIAYNIKKEIRLKLLPIAITYSSFQKYGKRVRLAAGSTLPALNLFPAEDLAKNYLFFNSRIQKELEQLIQLPSSVPTPRYLWGKPLARLGRILHYPYYWLISNRIRNKTNGTVFYDSVLFGVLLLTYPLYLLLLHGMIFFFTGSLLLVILMLLIHLITARLAVLYTPE